MTTSTLSPPDDAAAPAANEQVTCYLCGADDWAPLVTAEDDLTGKPGRFTFVTCRRCGLAYQNPRVPLDRIGEYYDRDYIAHRRRTDWGILTPLYRRAMGRHDRRKVALVDRYATLEAGREVLDVGCGAGTFLARMREQHGVVTTGLDFKELSHLPAFEETEFRHGLFTEQGFDDRRFDVVTMWHYLEHDYDPLRTLGEASRVLKEDGRLVIEVPRLDSLSRWLFEERWPGLQAPQHTVLLDRARLLALVERAGLEVVDYLPYGAFPAYFYLFAGTAFKRLKGRGLDLQKAIAPYFLGQLALTPVLWFERWLNLAMQTVVCRRRS